MSLKRKQKKYNPSVTLRKKCRVLGEKWLGEIVRWPSNVNFARVLDKKTKLFHNFSKCRKT